MYSGDRTNFGSAIIAGLIFVAIISAIIGWAVIEATIWLFSHISFSWS